MCAKSAKLQNKQYNTHQVLNYVIAPLCTRTYAGLQCKSVILFVLPWVNKLFINYRHFILTTGVEPWWFISQCFPTIYMLLV